jgi:hypothetical protein
VIEKSHFVYDVSDATFIVYAGMVKYYACRKSCSLITGELKFDLLPRKGIESQLLPGSEDCKGHRTQDQRKYE